MRKSAVTALMLWVFPGTNLIKHGYVDLISYCVWVLHGLSSHLFLSRYRSSSWLYLSGGEFPPFSRTSLTLTFRTGLLLLWDLVSGPFAGSASYISSLWLRVLSLRVPTLVSSRQKLWFSLFFPHFIILFVKDYRERCHRSPIHNFLILKTLLKLPPNSWLIHGKEVWSLLIWFYLKIPMCSSLFLLAVA